MTNDEIRELLDALDQHAAQAARAWMQEMMQQANEAATDFIATFHDHPLNEDKLRPAMLTRFFENVAKEAAKAAEGWHNVLLGGRPE